MQDKRLQAKDRKQDNILHAKRKVPHRHMEGVIIAQCPIASRCLEVYLLPLYSYTSQGLEVLVSLHPADSRQPDRDTSDTDPADRQRVCQSRRVEGERFVRGAIGGGILCWEVWLD
jgi:hypothetical protein